MTDKLLSVRGRWLRTFIHRSCDTVGGDQIPHSILFNCVESRGSQEKSSQACQDRNRIPILLSFSPLFHQVLKPSRRACAPAPPFMGVRTDVSKHTSPWRYGTEAKCEFCSKCISSTCRINLLFCSATFSSSEWHFLWLLCARAAQLFSLGHIQCVITSPLR